MVVRSTLTSLFFKLKKKEMKYWRKEDDYKELINFSKPINSSRDYIEKDDYER